MPNRDRFSFRFEARMTAETEAEIMVYSAITSEWNKWDETEVSALDFDKAIKGIKGAKSVKLRINSPGGDVFEAVAMRNALLGAGFPNLSISIEGICASAATLLACLPGAKVFMGEGSQYMIHNPRSVAIGTAARLETVVAMLRNAENDFRAIYAERCGADDAKVKTWMDAETWFTAKTAVENGFADAVIETQERMVACVSPEAMTLMRGEYAHIPEAVAVMEAAQPPVSTDDPTNAAGASTENKTTHEEEGQTMADTKMTPEQLKAQDPEMYESIVRGGAEAERTRMQEIDDLTPTGYEAMAAEAKKAGTSAMDYHKKVVAAQREKTQAFTKNRADETAASAKVTGGASDDTAANAAAEAMERNAKEIAGYAKAYAGDDSGSMY
ncbi:MAG: Clp protease ClpP [Eubacteriales bacterium]|nr:Clp protease ClpP [Eubacteriales bacterium]